MGFIYPQVTQVLVVGSGICLIGEIYGWNDHENSGRVSQPGEGRGRTLRH